MDNVKEYLLNAEVAFSNKQYNEALAWYQKILEKTPNNLYVLSNAGETCVRLEKFEDALKYLGEAKRLDSNNGDRAFYYANACFFNKDNVGAFYAYVEAEVLGCSKDVKPRLYYQMALLCSMRQDIKSALIYFRKCEAADRRGSISLNPELISEKMKLYMKIQDYENAGKCAADLVAVQPTQFRNYMIYFSILMAKKDFDKAEKVLNDAQNHAETLPDDKTTIFLQLSALYVARAENDEENNGRYFEQAVNILKKCISEAENLSEQVVSMVITLAEVYQKSGEYNKSVKCLQSLLKSQELITEVSDMKREMVKELTLEEIENMALADELTSEEINDKMLEDINSIQERINMGELPDEFELDVAEGIDEYGNLMRKFTSGNDFEKAETETSDDNSNNLEVFEISMDNREKIYFTLLSCYLEMEDFSSAKEFAMILRHSANKRYSYYGIYTYAMISRKLNMNEANKAYAEAIAFFRNKSFADYGDVLAVIFRARLYAEQGKYEKAKELAVLLADDDRNSLLEYIEKCEQ